jgi:DNA repair protein SbcC/Rad50
MRLQSITLKDFQAHRETEISFGPTITTIKGPTDRGKSAILRALQWAALNSIAGDEFIREGSKSTTVTLTIESDGQREIVRHRGSTNTYELDGDEFKAFGQGVPIDIAELLQISEINFQGQHDAPFWFSETAGEVSRQLNSVIDLSVIDTTLTNIASEVRKAQERVGLTEERLEEAKKIEEELVPQQARVEEFKTLQERHERQSKLTVRADQLDGVIRRIREHRQCRDWCQEKGEEGSQVLVTAKEVLSLSRTATSLGDILDRIAHQQTFRQPPAFGPVKEFFTMWQQLERDEEALRLIMTQISQTGMEIDKKKATVQATEKRFHERTKGRACPLCNKQF